MRIVLRFLPLLLCVSLFGQQETQTGAPLVPLAGTLQSGATANGNGTALTVNGYITGVATVNCSVACTGGTTVTFQGSQDGSNYFSIFAVQLGVTPSVVASAITNQNTTPTLWALPLAGLQSIRAVISAYTAGTITVTANAVGGTPAYTSIGVTGTGPSGNGIPRVSISTDSQIANVQLAQSVNTKVSSGTGTTITNAFGSNTTAGNTIVCLAQESATAAPVITDAQGNTYVVVASGTTAPGYSISVAQNIAGGTTDTVTSTTTSGAAAFQCAELKGAVYVGAAWGLSNAQQGTGATITFATGTVGSPGEMLFAAAGLGGGTVNATPSLGGNNTSLVTVDNANTSVSGGAALSDWYSAHTSMDSAKTFTQTISLSASETYTGLIVAIKPSRLPITVVNPISAPGIVANVPAANVSTYSASKLGLVPASSPTDIAVLSGNATNTVVPTYVSLSCTQTTAGIIQVQLVIRTTADSSGTSTGSPTSYPLDQNNTAAVSSVLTYTANPMVNDGSTRVIDSQNVGAMAPATAVPNDIYIWRPGMGQSVVLRGTAQQLAINLNATTLTGGSCDVTYRWIETTGL